MLSEPSTAILSRLCPTAVLVHCSCVLIQGGGLDGVPRSSSKTSHSYSYSYICLPYYMWFGAEEGLEYTGWMTEKRRPHLYSHEGHHSCWMQTFHCGCWRYSHACLVRLTGAPWVSLTGPLVPKGTLDCHWPLWGEGRQILLSSYSGKIIKIRL